VRRTPCGVEEPRPRFVVYRDPEPIGTRSRHGRHPRLGGMGQRQLSAFGSTYSPEKQQGRVLSGTSDAAIGCAWCGRVFTNLRSETRILNGERVCRRPCSLRPLYISEGHEVGRIRWAGEHIQLTDREVTAIQRLLGKDGQGLIDELARRPLSRSLKAALRKLGAGFAPSRSPVAFRVVEEKRDRWSVRFIKPS
jgi:hypothetical protein